MSNISIKYGNYTFKPVPNIEFSSDIKRSEAGYLLGTVDKITLKGFLFGSGTVMDTGVTTTNNSFNNLMIALTGLKSAIDKDYEELNISCGTTQVYRSDKNVTYVDSINFTNNTNENWLQIIDYNIVFSVFNTGNTNLKLIQYIQDSGYLVSNFVDSYSINTNDESFYKYVSTHRPNLVNFGLELPSYTVTRNISANGIEAANRSALNNAKFFVSGLTNSKDHGFAVMLSGLHIYDRSTNITQDSLNGTYGIQDTFIAYSGSSGWTDSYTVNATTTLDTEFNRTVNINGTIKGLTPYNSSNDSLYDKMIDNTFSTDKSNNGYKRSAWLLASGAFYGTIHPSILNRVSGAWVHNTGMFNDLSSLTGCSFSGLIMNPVPLSVSIEHDIPNGSITYDYSYDNRPLQVVTGALNEELEVIDSFSVRQYSFPEIFYRMPIAQDIGTYNLSSRQVSYSATIAAPTGCPPPDPFDYSNTNNSTRRNQVMALIEKFNPSGLRPLTSNNRGPQFFSYPTENRESYNITDNKYTYNVTWEYHKAFYQQPSTFNP